MKKAVIKLIIAILTAVVTTTAVCFLFLYTKNRHNVYTLSLEQNENKDIKIFFVCDIMFDIVIRYFAD